MSQGISLIMQVGHYPGSALSLVGIICTLATKAILRSFLRTPFSYCVDQQAAPLGPSFTSRGTRIHLPCFLLSIFLVFFYHQAVFMHRLAE